MDQEELEVFFPRMYNEAQEMAEAAMEKESPDLSQVLIDESARLIDENYLVDTSANKNVTSTSSAMIVRPPSILDEMRALERGDKRQFQKLLAPLNHDEAEEELVRVYLYIGSIYPYIYTLVYTLLTS